MTNRQLTIAEILDMVTDGEISTTEAKKLLVSISDRETSMAVEFDGELDDFPAVCPSCCSSMVITKAQCPNCSVALNGTFAPCVFCTLSKEHQELLHLFLKCRGNLREIGRSLKLSYPTIRSRLEALLLALEIVDKEELSPLSVIKALRGNKMSVDEACNLLSKNRNKPNSTKRPKKQRYR